MDETDQELPGIGAHLAQARKLAKLSQEAVAAELAERGFAVKGKGTVSAWETGGNVPSALVIKELARLYDTTADVLLGISSRSAEAERLAVIFDSLEPTDREALMNVCDPFLEARTGGAQLIADATNRDAAARPRRNRTVPNARRN